MGDNLTQIPDSSKNPRDQNQRDTVFRGSSIESRYKAAILLLSGLLLTFIIFSGFLVFLYNQSADEYSRAGNQKPESYFPHVEPDRQGAFTSYRGFFEIGDPSAEVTPIWLIGRFSSHPCVATNMESYSVSKGTGGFSLWAATLNYECQNQNYTAVDFIKDYFRSWDCPDCVVKSFSEGELQSILEERRVDIQGENVDFTIVGYDGEAGSRILGAGVYEDVFLYIIESSYEDGFADSGAVLSMKELLPKFRVPNSESVRHSLCGKQENIRRFDSVAICMENVQQTLPTVSTPPALTQEATENWRTYTNNFYHLELKYPDNYTLNENADKIEINSPLSECNPALVFNTIEYKQMYEVQIITKKRYGSLEKILGEEGGKIYGWKDKTFNGKKGFSIDVGAEMITPYTRFLVEGYPGEVLDIQSYVFASDDLGRCVPKLDFGNASIVSNQILSTFKFLE